MSGIATGFLAVLVPPVPRFKETAVVSGLATVVLGVPLASTVVMGVGAGASKAPNAFTGVGDLPTPSIGSDPTAPELPGVDVG